MAPNHENRLSQGLVVFLHGQKLGRFFRSVLRCPMVRSVSSQEKRQITVTLFLLLHPFYHLLLLNFFLLLPELEDGSSILLYSFYYDFHQIFILQKKKNFNQSFFPLNVPMALDFLVLCLDDWFARTKSDTSDE